MMLPLQLSPTDWLIVVACIVMLAIWLDTDAARHRSRKRDRTRKR